ncbi:MAG: glycoside hydrolase family 3 C-terminal domain-containing protein [Chitinispirillaceae bacterium]|nr:glycoside hydrolase family 3 C-terminal domain-containing protein [Chitinispirillaceae bacterium]
MISSYLARTPLFSLVLLFFSTLAAFGQSGDFTNAGKVVSSGGSGIANATITYTNLSKRLLWDFSDANGNFGATSGALPDRSGLTDRIAVASGPLDIAVFDFSGKTVASLRSTGITAGSYLLEQLAHHHSPGFLLVTIRTGTTEYCRKLLVRNRGSSLHSGTAFSASAGRASPLRLVAASAIDTLRIGKTGYAPVKIPIASYTANIGSVTLTPIDIEAQVTALLGQMSQNEKIGQILQSPLPGTGPVQSNLMGMVFSGGGGPSGQSTTASQWASSSNSYQNASLGTAKKIPLLIGSNIVHGFSDCYNGTMPPHNIGLGCTFDPAIVQKVYRVAAIESRGGGVNWAFAPCIAVPRDDRWGRVYEGFAETPDLTSALAKASVLGFQLTDLSHPLTVAACVKHFAGDGGAVWGTGVAENKLIDRGNATGADATLRAIHLPGYTASVQAGAASIMASFSAWNGVRMHQNAALLTDWLKTNQGFDGFINGDWLGHVTFVTGGTQQEQSRNCFMAGLDAPMPDRTDGFAPIKDALNAMITGGSSSRVDDAVKRILRVKLRMGLMSGSVMTNPQVTALAGNAQHRALAREAVRKSLVLLKTSTGLLPLAKTAKVTLVGQHSQDIGMQCGGWTLSWQGLTGNITAGKTIRQGFEAIGGASNISYSADGNTIGGDIAVVCTGERPYAEWYGDSTNIVLPGASLVTNAKKSGKKVIVIIISGRPLDVSAIMNSCDGLIAAWLPGTEGDGIAEVLYGNYAFTGKLAFSWPRSVSQEPINYGDASYDPLFPYDFGLNFAGQQLPKGLY